MPGPWDAEWIEFDEDNLAELARHGIGAAAVEEVFRSAPTWVPNRKHRAGDWKMLGSDAGGRRLTIVVRHYQDRRSIRPITGWDTTAGERSRYG